MVVAVCVFAMVVTPWAVRVPMSSENDEPSQVRGESQTADNQNQLGVPNLWRVKEPCKRFEDDGYAEGDEEDGVEEGAQNLGAEPLGRERVSKRP
jgi:hypothetical protein